MYPYGSKDLRLLDTAIQVPFPIAVKVHHLQTAWGLADWGLRNCWVEEDKDSGKDVWYFDVLQLRAWGLGTRAENDGIPETQHTYRSNNP